MSLNVDCVRSLLLGLEADLAVSKTGKLPRPIRLKLIFSQPPLSAYPPEEVFSAAKYLVDKKLVTIGARNPKLIPFIEPIDYRFLSVTPNGQEYLSFLRNDTVWKKLSKRVGNVFDATVPELLALTAELGIKLLLG